MSGYIRTLEDISTYLDLVTVSPEQSLYRKSGFGYGQEMVNPMDVPSLKGMREVGISFGINKALLIENIVEFVAEHRALFSADQINGLVKALKVASATAENAEAPVQDGVMPDPRYTTCLACAEGLGILAGLDVSDSNAIETLFELGSTNFKNRQLGLLTSDSAVIGYAYLRELVFLGCAPHTSEQVEDFLLKKIIHDQENVDYVGQIALGIIHHSDVGSNPKALPRLTDRLTEVISISNFFGLLVQGMKVEDEGSRGLGFISAALSNVVSFPSVRPHAEQILEFIRGSIREEADHDRLLGGKMSNSGPIIVQQMVRTLDRALSVTVVSDGEDLTP